jgi:hypothetical protein
MAIKWRERSDPRDPMRKRKREGKEGEMLCCRDFCRRLEVGHKCYTAIGYGQTHCILAVMRRRSRDRGEMVSKGVQSV